jgi:hypothetical protein
LFANDKRFDLQKILNCKSFAEFTTYFISKQLGYQTVTDYHNGAQGL